MKNSNFHSNEIEVSISAEQIEAAMTPKQKKALDKNKDGKVSKEDFELLRKSKSMDKKQYDKIDKKELKQDTKKEKVEHEKDAIKDDKSKIKKLDKGAPSEKKSIEKKDLKKDMKFDKDSKKKMEADYGNGGKKVKPKKSYAQMLTDIAAERYGKKKEAS